VLSRDTDPLIEARQVERWRAMTAEEKLMTAASASAAVRELAMAGLRLRHPSANEREIFLRYAMLTLGVETAAMVYPDARPLIGT
jgi:hypothetical protein